MISDLNYINNIIYLHFVVLIEQKHKIRNNNNYIIVNSKLLSLFVSALGESMSTHSFYKQINQQLEQTRQDGLFPKMSGSSLLRKMPILRLLMVVMLLTFVPITT